MKLTSSYIFLEHPNKKTISHKDQQGNLVLELGNNIYSFIRNAFPSAVEDTKTDEIFRTTLTYNLIEDNIPYRVSFIITEIEKTTYLDIIIEGKRRIKLVSYLESIQDKLLNSKLRHYYVDIISYDAVSEYYCNKSFGKLNELERNLRKLLFNIYILHFGKDYYSATMSKELQDKIKGVIRSRKIKEPIQNVKKIYRVDKDDAEKIVRLQQFFYSLEFADIQKFLFTPTWTPLDKREHSKFLTSHEDLSILSDIELRNAFEKFAPKSDWDRFFSSKITILEIESLVDDIRNYRNIVAHCKLIDKNTYKKYNQLILRLNKAVVNAIRITEEKDFAQKNADLLNRTLLSISQKISELMKPIQDGIQNFLSSPAIQTMQEFAKQIQESVQVKRITDLVSSLTNPSNSTEATDPIDEDENPTDDDGGNETTDD